MAFWTPGYSKDCILPLHSSVQVPQGGRVLYLNEEQRNVHIWNSLPAQRSPGGAATAFQLVAGEF
jgi:hypothetical protein